MDAVKLLTQDHRTVDRLFNRYESLDVGADEERKRIVEEIVRELSIHASIEEQVLYPGVRDVLPGGDQLAEEALDEHQEVKETLAELEKMSPSDAGFDLRVRSLIRDVRHHVDEEESEMFPKLTSAIPKKKLEEMGDRMEKAKRIAPTRPHPRAPNTPPGNLVAGPMAAVVDRARDAASGRGKTAGRKKTSGKTTTRKTGTRKGTSSKRTAAKKTARTSSARKAGSRKTAARKTSGRKSTAKKTTAKRTSAKKTSAKKTSPRKATTRKPSSRKSPSRKSSARKSSSTSSSRKSGGRKASGRKSTSRKSTTRRSSS